MLSRLDEDSREKLSRLGRGSRVQLAMEQQAKLPVDQGRRRGVAGCCQYFHQRALGALSQRVHRDCQSNVACRGGEIRPAIRNGDLAATSTARAGNATVEVARRQLDGTWLWLTDQLTVLG